MGAFQLEVFYDSMNCGSGFSAKSETVEKNRLSNPVLNN